MANLGSTATATSSKTGYERLETEVRIPDTGFYIVGHRPYPGGKIVGIHLRYTVGGDYDPENLGFLGAFDLYAFMSVNTGFWNDGNPDMGILTQALANRELRRRTETDLMNLLTAREVAKFKDLTEDEQSTYLAKRREWYLRTDKDGEPMLNDAGEEVFDRIVIQVKDTAQAPATAGDSLEA